MFVPSFSCLGHVLIPNGPWRSCVLLHPFWDGATRVAGYRWGVTTPLGCRRACKSFLCQCLHPFANSPVLSFLPPCRWQLSGSSPAAARAWQSCRWSTWIRHIVPRMTEQLWEGEGVWTWHPHLQHLPPTLCCAWPQDLWHSSSCIWHQDLDSPCFCMDSVTYLLLPFSRFLL